LKKSGMPAFGASSVVTKLLPLPSAYSMAVLISAAVQVFG